jgi:quercetin dioxygenase-like cupin family protein
LIRHFNIENYTNFNDEQANKFGLFTCDSCTISVWTLTKGQAVPMHCHQDGEEILIINSGKGYLLTSEDNENITNAYEPNPYKVVLPTPKNEAFHANKQKVGTGSCIFVPKATFHGFENLDDENMVVLSIAFPQYIRCKYLPR